MLTCHYLAGMATAAVTYLQSQGTDQAPLLQLNTATSKVKRFSFGPIYAPLCPANSQPSPKSEKLFFVAPTAALHIPRGV